MEPTQWLGLGVLVGLLGVWWRLHRLEKALDALEGEHPTSGEEKASGCGRR